MTDVRSSTPTAILAAAIIAGAGVGWGAGMAAGGLLSEAEPGAGRLVGDGPWRFPEGVGRTDASALTRARLANSGPLGLSASEAVYFLAYTDGEGRRLSSHCEYTVSGSGIDARWWSLTVYDASTYDFLSSLNDRASWTSVDLDVQADEAWTIRLGPAPRPAPWIPTAANERTALELLLRVYNPSDGLREQLPEIGLPEIERNGCDTAPG